MEPPPFTLSPDKMLKISLHPPGEGHHICKHFEGDLCPATTFYSEILLIQSSNPFAISFTRGVILTLPDIVPRVDTHIFLYSQMHH